MALAEQIADGLLDAIIEGKVPPQTALPTELELAGSFGVSRLTIREAIRILRAQNIVRIERGRGTSVNPPEAWTSLEAIGRASSGTLGAGAHVGERLLEARRMIEIGAAQLAALRRSADDLVALDGHVSGMRAAAAEGDVDTFVAEDIAFHDVIMRASGNLFIRALFSTFGPLLIETRRQTSAVPAIQYNAIEHHNEILHSIRKADDDLARVAMERHMNQTQRDLRQHVLGTAVADSEVPTDG